MKDVRFFLSPLRGVKRGYNTPHLKVEDIAGSTLGGENEVFSERIMKQPL